MAPAGSATPAAETSPTAQGSAAPSNLGAGVDGEAIAPNQRQAPGLTGRLLAALCIAYTVFHIGVMNFYPLETWTYRLIHVAGGLTLGFLLFSSGNFRADDTRPARRLPGLAYWLALLPAAAALITAFVQGVGFWATGTGLDHAAGRDAMLWTFGIPLAAGTGWALLLSWIAPLRKRGVIDPTDLLLALAAITVALYLIFHAEFLRLRAGTALAKSADMYAALAGVILILEITRRLAGLALVAIAGVFMLYSLVGPWLPGILEHRGYTAMRFLTYIYTDQGILGPTTAISSTYIILFVTFAAFLQVSRVGEYFVNFAFAAAGGSRGGPAKVAVFGSGLMGMINGTSAGNVVSTGSLTIPLMKRVGYPPQTSAAVEAAASSGGQILPPIMGAGAFIMAEITGIPYTEIVVAAIIPAVLYFASIYFMVDLAAIKSNMRGLPRSELPKFARLARQVYMFIPIIMLIGLLFSGYSVIRAGTVAMAAAAMISWLTPYKMGPGAVVHAFEIAARMSLQLVAVCAAAGIIVGVIALTGIGTRFSSLLLTLADQNQLIALFFAMVVSIILGMGMPTTAAYAVAASVIAPGLIEMGIEPLTAHFFIFYFAVMSAITPPVALAAYAGSAIAQSDPMKTSVESFKIGLAAFVVPFMFFSSPQLLMQGAWYDILHVAISAGFGIFLLAAAVQAYFFGPLSMWLRGLLGIGALSMIAGGWFSDAVGLSVAIVVWAINKRMVHASDVARGLD
ncbi:TRAP transporter permease [Wenzhouxiangella sp. XN24]|nr:TRAP transporter permease [Wenzhouxiangella sp. XN24]